MAYKNYIQLKKQIDTKTRIQLPRNEVKFVLWYNNNYLLNFGRWWFLSKEKNTERSKFGVESLTVHKLTVYVWFENEHLAFDVVV
jgi:hypothetical protein